MYRRKKEKYVEDTWKRKEKKKVKWKKILTIKRLETFIKKLRKFPKMMRKVSC